MFRSTGFFDKNLYSSQMKSERALPCWTLYNGYFTSFRLIEDIGKFLIIYQKTFPKDAKNDILFYFGWGFYLRCGLFGEGEGEKNHLSTQKSPKSPRHREPGLASPLSAAPAAIPSGTYPTQLDVIWSLTKDSWWWANMKVRCPLCYSPLQQFYPTRHPVVRQLCNVPCSLELGAQIERGRTEGGNIVFPGQERLPS